ncbi:hypothetical protein ckin74_07330 [Helicobacter pylori]
MRSFKIICESGREQNSGDLDRSVKEILMICFANKKTAIKNLKMLKGIFYNQNKRACEKQAITP